MIVILRHLTSRKVLLIVVFFNHGCQKIFTLNESQTVLEARMYSRIIGIRFTKRKSYAMSRALRRLVIVLLIFAWPTDAGSVLLMPIY